MTKKDYVLIARNIKALQDCSPDGNSVLNTLAINLADDLQRDNPRFDKQIFLNACGTSDYYVALANKAAT